MDIPKGFEVVDSPVDIPEGFEVVTGSYGKLQPVYDQMIASGVPEIEAKEFISKAQSTSRGDLEAMQGEAGVQPSSAAGSFSSGFERGAMSLGEGIMQKGAEALGAMGIDTNQFLDELARNRAIEQRKTDIETSERPILGAAGEIVGNVAPVAAAAPAGLGANVVLGALFGGSEYDANLGDAAIGGLFGAGGKLTADALGKVYRSVKGNAPRSTQDLIEFAKANDLPYMTTDAVPPKTFVGKSAQSAGEKIPFAGTGPARAGQQAKRSELIEDYSKQFGEYNPNEIYESLASNVNIAKRNAGQGRGAIVDQIADVNTAAEKTVSAIDAEIKRLSTTPSGVLKETADSQTIDQLNRFKNDILADPTFSNLEQLRSVFRENVKGERVLMPGRTQAGIDRVYSAMGEDMKNVVSSNLGDEALTKWNQFNKIYANETGRIKNTKLKNILNKGDLTPEVVNSMLFSNKPSEVKILFNSLTPDGKAAARNGLIGKAVEKATRKGEVSPEIFSSELERMSKQLGIAFDGADKKYLDGMKNYLDATQQASKAAIQTPTGQQLYQIAVPSAAAGDVMATGGIGLMGAGGYGLLARAYESKPIRDLMIRMGSMEKGSSAFEKTLDQLNFRINALSQASLNTGVPVNEDE